MPLYTYSSDRTHFFFLEIQTSNLLLINYFKKHFITNYILLTKDYSLRPQTWPELSRAYEQFLNFLSKRRTLSLYEYSDF